ncbi:Protein of unknown function DUF966 [Cynara cardunculus var. scolymus]|uniref:SOSEKI DIX-like domain-containing protein n=1 Tax=Cynara cardunculus var. scolymus TaxID=59895 RepID=A0A103Y143_CYNCS|nr:Protein of unknown function DUF966 [Cynara cardunculus var. scolymus]
MVAQVGSRDGGGQVRRVHIVYFLSRNGCTEHPHLFRVHHISRNGVRLRDIDSYSEKDIAKSSFFEINVKGPKYPSIEKEYPRDFSTNTSTDIEESSFVSNVTTEDTTKNQDENKDEIQVQSQKDDIKNNSSYETLLDKNTNNNNNNSKSKKGRNKSATKAPPSPTYSFGKPRRISGSRATHMFRNWITCGTANTHETALVVVNRRNGSTASTENNEYNSGQVCKDRKLRGFEKSFDTKEGSKKSKKEDPNNIKTFAAAYKPVNGPNCS